MLCTSSAGTKNNLNGKTGAVALVPFYEIIAQSLKPIVLSIVEPSANFLARAGLSIDVT